jgi:hypothetical protein
MVKKVYHGTIHAASGPFKMAVKLGKELEFITQGHMLHSLMPSQQLILLRLKVKESIISICFDSNLYYYILQVI